jgi:thiosulfate/3-mercaptopyruvate sulfurtransferase
VVIKKLDQHSIRTGPVASILSALGAVKAAFEAWPLAASGYHDLSYRHLMFTTLVDTPTLATHLSDPDWVVVDCRFSLTDEPWGRREYLSRHIPGAVYAHLERDLSGPVTGHNGRHPLPDPEALVRTLGGFGIAGGVQVVVYDQGNGMFAVRLWWLLRWMGHDGVALLDGGFGKWTAEKRATSAGEEKRARRPFTGSPRPDMVVDVDQVARLAAHEPARLIDARAPERYRGEVEPIDRVAGHIPGAVNDYYMQNLAEDGTFRSPEALRDRLTMAIGGASPKEIVCYCGSGVTACHNLLALERAGLPGARLYPGSWSEWSSDPSRPVEQSPDIAKEKGPAM